MVHPIMRGYTVSLGFQALLKSNQRRIGSCDGKQQLLHSMPPLFHKVCSLPLNCNYSNHQLVFDNPELPNLSTKNVNAIFQITLNSFVIMCNDSRMYIGKILDMYKKGSSGRYGSVTKSTNLAELQAVSLLVYLPLLTVRFHFVYIVTSSALTDPVG